MKSFSTCLGLLIAILVVLAGTAFSQDPPPAKKRVPTLTTEDVIRSRVGSERPQPAEGAPKQPADSKAVATTGAATEKHPAKVEEVAWRAAVKRAREASEAAQKLAEETEIKVTQLRNQLGASGHTSQERDELARDMEVTGKQVLELRTAARLAREEYEKILEDGHAKGFTEEEGPEPVGPDGKANVQYYKSRFAELSRIGQDTARRVTMYENRVRDYNQRIMTNAKTGDNFYILQVQQERDEAQSKLEEARRDYQKAVEDIEALQEEARRAGLPPGIFR